jgi:peptide/nickel transport system ATP-binding protein
VSSDLHVVFQDPYTSLNPALTIERILTEPLTVRKIPKTEASRRVRDLLDQVKLPPTPEADSPANSPAGNGNASPSPAPSPSTRD